MEKGLFSIVIPTYNSKQYSGECVASSLNQTYQNVEVVVDDNASTDGTGELLQSEFGEDSRFRLFERKEDLNMPLGWNRGFQDAKGEYLMLLHSDNLLHPKFVESMVHYLEKYEAQIAFSDSLYFEGETPENLFNPNLDTKNLRFDLLAAGSSAVGHIFRYQRMIPISVVALRRTALMGEEPFSTDFAWDPDMELLTRMADRHGIVKVYGDLGAMRSHPLQAPNWRTSTYRTQYEKLLKLQHKAGNTEPFHYLIHRASSHEDICRRISKLEITFFPFLGYLGRWFKAETKNFNFFLRHYLRKVKLIGATLSNWVASRGEVAVRLRESKSNA